MRAAGGLRFVEAPTAVKSILEVVRERGLKGRGGENGLYLSGLGHRSVIKQSELE
jgi:hypothetical protein